jgi:predicted amidohydrolase YtcJ
LFFSCNSQKQADLIVHNAVVYTVDDKFSVAEAFAVKDGKIVETGSSEDILKKYKGEILDAGREGCLSGLH